MNEATYVLCGDAEGLGDAFVQLLDVGEVADLASRGAMSQLAVKDHVKLLSGRSRSARGRWQRTILIFLSHVDRCVRFKLGLGARRY